MGNQSRASGLNEGPTQVQTQPIFDKADVTDTRLFQAGKCLSLSIPSGSGHLLSLIELMLKKGASFDVLDHGALP